MEDFVGPLPKLVSCIATPICNYVDHYMNFGDAVNQLIGKMGDLYSRKQDIISRIEREAGARQIVKDEVRNWIALVETINGEVQAVLQKAQRVKGWRRACLGKHVRRKIDEVKEVHEKGSFTEGLLIARAPNRGIFFSTENFGGEISTKDEIWKYLIGNEVGMIGVCGIGGVGKTTIMRHVNDDLLCENRFDRVIWVTVSYPLNVFELQKKIASVMGKTLPEDEQMRRAELKDIMREVTFVLILDDVWEKFSLEDVGIPEPVVQNGCKVVITSRSIEVCNYFHCKIVQVQPLSQEKSLELFRNTVGDGVSRVPGLEDIVKSMVKECAGLPQAIVVIAATMRGVDDVNVWKNALIELQDHMKTVSGWDGKLFQRLRFSYDRLDELDIKKCFLYCSLFREDYEFSRTELIEGWIDDGLIDIAVLGSRQNAYYRGHAFLDRLVKHCLIEKIAVQHKSEDVFKMHDVVRDMAINIGPEFGYMVKELRGVQQEHGWAKDVIKLSLMAIHTSKLPVSLSLQCPTLSTLILSDNYRLSEIPESLFEDMGELKVLDLSRTGIEALPGSISNLKKLTALRLRLCRRLKCLPSLENLKALKKLDLRRAGIKVVPQGMEMLECLEYLDLYCHLLEEIPRGILSKLSSLQSLVTTEAMEHSRVRINVEELARLGKLEILECDFDGMQDFNHFLSKFNFQSLTTYKLEVGSGSYVRDAANHEFKFILKFVGCDIGQECIGLPRTLQHLSIHCCRNMRSSLNKTALIENATELSLCVINGCEEIETMVELDSSSSSLCPPVLDKLERLCLWDLPRLSVLVRVEGGSTPPRVFSSLKHLEVSGCSGMRKLLPLELLQRLQNLESIEVWHCERMEEIIALSNSDASSDKFTITFPKLRKLYLSDLPQLKSIYSAKGVMVCDSIEEIWIKECLKLERISVQLPLLENGQPSPPPRLKQIYIDEESKEWWESVKWDHPNAKNVLQPFVEYYMGRAEDIYVPISHVTRGNKSLSLTIR